MSGQGTKKDGRPDYGRENIDTIADLKFLRLYDLKYAEGKHYYNASRRKAEDLVALKEDSEFKSMLPDAVTIAVVIILKGESPKLLMNYEYRYPVGQYLLSPVAGLIDPEDLDCYDPLKEAAVREIKEEIGISVKPTDKIEIINPCAFSSPGMTDESNAFLCAELHVDDTESIRQDGAVGSELFAGFELIDAEEAKRLYMEGRDRNGNYFSLATYAVLGYFVMKY